MTDSCPKALADLVEHLLKKTPEKRPENANEVAERLAEMLADAAVKKHSVGPDDKGAIPARGIRENSLNLTQRLQSGSTTGPHKANWKALAIAAGVVVLVILVALALQGGN